jgi:type VI secretion system protein VasD
MSDQAEYVGIVAFFRKTDQDSTWKLVVPKKQWKQTDPVKVDVWDSTLQRVGAKPEPIRRQAPQQSVPNPLQPKPVAGPV